MILYGGIDGGQSSTTAVVGDADGRVLGRGAAGPADEVGCDARSTRLKDALEGALAAALDDAKLPRESRLETIVAGISGYTGETVGVAPSFNAANVRLMHDAPIAHAGALGGKPGVIVIAGTGSVVYGVAEDGRAVTVGGWGYLFGDEGSAFWIGKSAIVRALEADDAGNASPFLDLVRARFAVSPREVVIKLYAGRLGRDAIAAFATDVLGLRSEESRSLVFPGALRLIDQAWVAIQELRLPHDAPVALVGGLSRNPEYVDIFELSADGADNQVDLAEAQDEPAIGALMLAREA